MQLWRIRSIATWRDTIMVRMAVVSGWRNKISVSVSVSVSVRSLVVCECVELGGV